MSLLGVDVGGSGCKAIVFSAMGARLAKCSRNYSYTFINERESEFLIKEIWENVKLVIKDAAKKAKDLNDPVEALCFSVFGEASILVDKDLNPLTNIFTSFDPRGEEFLGKIAEDLKPVEIYKKTGQPLDFIYPPVKLMWLKKNRRELFKKPFKFLGVQEFLLLKLGGEPITDPSLASRYLFFDITKKTWIKKYLEYFEIKEADLPFIGRAGDTAGIVSEKMATELGLSSKVKLIVGGMDQAMSSSGGGLVAEGTGTIGTGTVEAMSFVKKDIILDSDLFKHYFPFCAHILSDLYLTIAYSYSGGSILKWSVNNLASDAADSKRTGKNIYDQLLEKMPEKPSSLVALPTFTGSQTFIRDPELRGTITGLSLNTDNGEILKALLEGTCFYLKQNYEYLSRKLGIKVNKFIAMGGGVRTIQWLQMKADILGIKITTLSEEDTGCISAAIFAGMGMKIFRNFKDSLKIFIKESNEYLPRDNYVEFYSGKYRLYKDLQEKILSFNHKLFKQSSVLFKKF